MDNAEIVARLEEVVKTLEREERKKYRRKAHFVGRLRRYGETMLGDYYREVVARETAEYDAIVARIAAVRAAIERLS